MMIRRRQLLPTVMLLLAAGLGEASARVVHALTPAFVTPTGAVYTMAMSPDRTRAVYLADADVAGQRGLYSVALAAPGIATRIDAGDNVLDFAISADGARVVYRATTDGSDVIELFSAPIAGGALPVRLNADLAITDCSGFSPCSRVWSFALGDDAQTVVYLANQDAANRWELYAVPITGGSPPRRLLEPAETYAHVLTGFTLSPDSNHVVYRADLSASGVYELFSAQVTGTGVPIRLNGPLVPGGNLVDGNTVNPNLGFLVTPDSGRVVYRADQDVDDVHELYSVPISGGTPVRLTPIPPPGGDVPPDFPYTFGESFAVSADGTRVIYRADHDRNDVDELYSVPVDGSAAPLRLNQPLVSGGDVTRFILSPDGTHVLFRADALGDERHELFVTTIDGSTPPTRINPTLVNGVDLSEAGLRYTPDGNHVLYGADQDVDNTFELYTVPADGSGPARKLNPPLDAGNAVMSDFAIAADSTRVVFEVNRGASAPPTQLYAAALDGSAPAVQLSAVPDGAPRGIDDFVLVGDATRVIYLADEGVPDVAQLYLAPLDGSTASVRLNGDLVTGGSVDARFWFTPDGERLLFIADLLVDEVTELFSVPLDASAAPVRLNAPLPPGGQVLRPVEVSPDGMRAVYRAEQDSAGVVELYSVPVDASLAPARLNGPLAPGGGVDQFTVTPDGTRVFYLAQQDSTRRELYSVPIAGGSTVRLSPPLGIGGEVGSGGATPDSSHVAFTFAADNASVRGIRVAPIATAGASVAVSGSLAAGAFAISPDGNRIVFGASETAFVGELYTVGIAGGPIRKLNGPLVENGDVLAWQVTASGNHVVYLADQDTDRKSELYAAPLPFAAAPQALTPALAADADVDSFRVAPTGDDVLYAVADDGAARSLFVASAGGGAPPLRIDEEPVAGGTIGDYAFTPDGTHVVYAADALEPGRHELYLAPLDGSAAPARLASRPAPPSTLGAWRINADGSRVVFLAAYGNGDMQLYSVPLVADVPPVVLNAPFSPGGGIDKFELAPDGRHAVYRADAMIAGEYRLFSVAIDHDGDAIPDPIDDDIDGDGLDNVTEDRLGTHAYLVDTDDDGLDDFTEVARDGDAGSYSPGIDTDPLHPDSDGDGIPDGADDDPLVPANVVVTPVPWPAWALAALAVGLFVVAVRMRRLLHA
ncbi:MAG: hypothetical protein RKL32_23845 [Gammaproteobacteria bacterium]